MSSESPPQELVLEDIVVRYGDLTAVDGVSLAVGEGRTAALLGPSGCGKSTLLRAVAGLEPLAAGTICWRGRDLSGVPVHQRGIGLMFQNHALFPHRNVADNIAFGLRMARVPRSARIAKVEELLRVVDLEGMGERTVGTLSGGQAQRVALARALAPEPEVLLLDEPLGSLDRQLRDLLVTEIRRITKDRGITTIHVTHDHDEAMSVADDIAFMDAGRIGAFGRIEELLRSPGDQWTAVALGLETVWRPDIADGRARTPFGSVAMPDDHAALLLPPSAIRVDASGATPAVVRGSRHRAGEWLLHCELGDDLVVAIHHDERLPDGTAVNLTANLDAAIPLR